MTRRSGAGTTALAVHARAIVLAAALAFIPLAAAQTSATTVPIEVQRGEYLARAGDCISCHTAKGGKPYAGGYRINTPFGFMLAPNITPDGATGIGNWSQDDFHRALHDGVNKRGQDMYPTMPYDFYTKVTREDSDAIYAYLRTVPAVSNPVTVNHLHFPFDQRWSMAAWRELYFTPGTFKPVAGKSAAWNRGAYLVEGLAHCSACHSPRNLLGGIERSKSFDGAAVDGWFALDLRSDLVNGLGAWTAQDIATYLKTGSFKGRTTALGPMAEVVRNSTSHLTAADLLAIGEYMKSLPPDSSLRTGRVRPDPVSAAGATLYLDHCAGCHQAKGRGIPGVFPPLAGNGVVNAPDPANVLNVILAGVPGKEGYIPMPPFGAQLDDVQIAQITNYVRSSWGNQAGRMVTTGAVATARAAK